MRKGKGGGEEGLTQQVQSRVGRQDAPPPSSAELPFSAALDANPAAPFQVPCQATKGQSDGIRPGLAPRGESRTWLFTKIKIRILGGGGKYLNLACFFKKTKVLALMVLETHQEASGQQKSQLKRISSTDTIQTCLTEMLNRGGALVAQW